MVRWRAKRDENDSCLGSGADRHRGNGDRWACSSVWRVRQDCLSIGWPQCWCSRDRRCWRPVCRLHMVVGISSTSRNKIYSDDIPRTPPEEVKIFWTVQNESLEQVMAVPVPPVGPVDEDCILRVEFDPERNRLKCFGLLSCSQIPNIGARFLIVVRCCPCFW